MAGASYRLFILVTFLGICRSQYFENEISRDNFDIHSYGKLSRVIDLDEDPFIKRINCKRELIQVAFHDDVQNNTWQANDIVVGGAKWGCRLNSINEHMTSIFAKVLSKKMVGKRRLDLVTGSASPTDVIEEASIVMHYDGQIKERRKRETRHKRDTYSNVLSSITDVINWDKTIDFHLPFNPDNRYIYLQKLRGTPDPILTLDDNGGNLHDDAELKFLCHNCRGSTSISYRLEIRIKRKNRKPVIQTFLSQVEGYSEVEYNMSLSALQEMSLNYTNRLWQTLPESVSVPLSQIKGLPELELSLSIQEDVNMDLEVITAGEFNSNIAFETKGKYVISEHQATSSPMTKQATPYEWKTESKGVKINSGSSLSAFVSIQQKISIKPHIKWTMKDIHVAFGSPIDISLRQEVQITTEMDAFSFITTNNDDTYIDAYSPKSHYYVEAFKLSIWNPLMSDDFTEKMKVLQTELYRFQQANCFVTVSDVEKNMEDVCGQPGTKITRDSTDFEKLTEIWGDKVLFLSEEATESTWCGENNRSCVHCDSSNGDVCADRLMLPSMAEAISRLSKFVSAEWPNLSLVISEAWDEPTSLYPNGKHGETSLFYEGRAAIVKLGKKDSSGSIDTIEDDISLKRLQELATCAGFDFAGLSDISTSLKLCLADGEHGSVRKKRQILDKANSVYDDAKTFFMELIGLDVTKTGALPKVQGYYPDGKTIEQVCGKMDEPISLDDQSITKRVLQYPFDDVEFSPEGPSDSTCYLDTRRCRDCKTYKYSEDPWQWCGTRIMTPRLAVRLRRLSELANPETGAFVEGCSGLKIVTRTQWNATKPKSVKDLSVTPVPYFFIHHTDTYDCFDTETCKERVRAIQKYHMVNNNWSDIGYSFLVGEDGNIYEGRGWTREGAHTYGYNGKSLAVSFIGNYTDKLPNEKAIKAVKSLISCGVEKNFIKTDYDLRGHRDVDCTTCPGQVLYEHIRTWPRYIYTGINYAMNKISRKDWGGRDPTSESLLTTTSASISYVVIHHTGNESCSDRSSCSEIVKNIQKSHMDENGWSDIGYNFLVGEDGNVYEGRGYTVVGKHTSGYDGKSIGIAIIGNFTDRKPNKKAFVAVQAITKCGWRRASKIILNGKEKYIKVLKKDYKLIGHNDVTIGETCPGNALYDDLKTWPQYTSQVNGRKKRDVTQATERLKVCRSSLSLSDCKKKLGNGDSEYCKKCLKEHRCCKRRCPYSQCTITRDGDKITHMKASCKDILGIHDCPSVIGIESKECRLFKKECIQDWCHTFSGPELRVLMKVIMIWEACSGIWNEQDIAAEMNDVSSDDYSLFEFFTNKCKSYLPTEYTCRYNYPKDPTIGIGWYLKRQASDFNRFLPGIDYDKVKAKTKCITERESFLLFAGSVIEKIQLITIGGIPIPVSDFVGLPLNVKVALINANFRGEFGRGVLKDFRAGVKEKDWQKAIKAFKNHPQYTSCRCDENPTGTKKFDGCDFPGICPRMHWNAKQFDSMDEDNNCDKCKESYKCTVEGSSFKCHCNPGYTGTYCDTGTQKMLQIEQTSSLSEGRNLKISSKSSTISNDKLAELAVMAGFDAVTIYPSYVEVGVKRQAGLKTLTLQYPLVNMIAAEPDDTDKAEFVLPVTNSKCPPLIDGFDPTVRLSDHYTIGDVQMTNRRYFRLDPVLLECLENLNFDTDSVVPIVKDNAYQTQSMNKMNFETKNSNERYNHQCGKAVKIQCARTDTKCNIKTLGTDLIRGCTPIIRQKRLGMGIGTHSDRLYFDIRDDLDEGVLVKLWDVNNKDAFDVLNEIQKDIHQGTDFITPINKERVCKTPRLGEDGFYIKDTNVGLCWFSDNTKLCESTRKEREDVAKNLLNDLLSTSSAGQISKKDLENAINQCLVKLCGGCIGRGEVWQSKIKACLDVVFLYKNSAAKPFPNMENKVAFFNTDNHQSEVHSLACHEGSVCLENLQMYSILVKYLMSKYNPVKGQSVPELLYAPNDNPSPLLDILEQVMAMQASGIVKVYLESIRDVVSLEQVIKILMIYNRKVTHVEFHLSPSADKERISASIQRKIDTWEVTVCPRRSRLMVAKYSVHTLSKERHKRSIEKSKDRNEAKLELRNWELDWLATV